MNKRRTALTASPSFTTQIRQSAEHFPARERACFLKRNVFPRFLVVLFGDVHADDVADAVVAGKPLPVEGDGVLEGDGDEQADRLGGDRGEFQPLQLDEVLPQAACIGR